MADRTGLFVKPRPTTPAQGTSPTDGRLVLGAAFGTTAGCLSGGALTASATQMQITVAGAVWRIPDPTNAAGVYLSPADPATLTFSAGPASGSRIDVLWVRQNNVEAGDTDSRVVYGVAAGVAASSPVEPAVPAGAMKIGRLTVPTGVSNAAACTLVASFAGRSVLTQQIAVVTEPQLPAVGDYVGQLAYVAQVTLGSSTVPVIERWSGSAWKRWDSDWATWTPVTTGFILNTSTWTCQFRFRSGKVAIRVRGAISGTQANTTWSISVPVLRDHNAGTLPSGHAVFTGTAWLFGLPRWDGANDADVIDFFTQDTAAAGGSTWTYIRTANATNSTSDAVINLEYDPA